MGPGLRAALSMTVVVTVVTLLGTACQEPPSDAAVPTGGRIIATTPPGTYVEIETASDDLSRVVYEQGPYTDYYLLRSGGSFHLIDESTGTTTRLPFPRRGGQTGVSLSADGTTLVFSSPDPTLQSGPVPMNCRDWHGLFQPLTPTYCAELYRYDPDTGEVEQLTGLDEPSPFHNVNPRLSADGSSVEFTISSLVPESGSIRGRLDLATGLVEELPASSVVTWDRGDTVVEWTPDLSRLTSTDVATGAVTRLPTPEPSELVSSSGNGRYVVLTAGNGWHHLVDTVEATTRVIPGTWVDDTASNYLMAQNNVAPDGRGRVINGPLALAP